MGDGLRTGWGTVNRGGGVGGTGCALVGDAAVWACDSVINVGGGWDYNNIMG